MLSFINQQFFSHIINPLTIFKYKDVLTIFYLIWILFIFCVPQPTGHQVIIINYTASLKRFWCAICPMYKSHKFVYMLHERSYFFGINCIFIIVRYSDSIMCFNSLSPYFILFSFSAKRKEDFITSLNEKMWASDKTILVGQCMGDNGLKCMPSCHLNSPVQDYFNMWIVDLEIYWH